MAELQVVFWRDIPAQVLVGRGRKAVKRVLEERFEQAIDRAAMKAGMAGTDDYLSEWRKSDPITVEGEGEEAAERYASQLEAEYDQARIKAIIENGGFET